MIIHKSWLRFVIIIVTGIALFPFLQVPAPVAADGVVNDCSNDSQLSALLPQGGNITFNCGGAYTITVGSQKVITTNVSIDASNGGFPIVLSGGGIRRIFFINSGITITLTNVTVTNGRALASNGGNISNAGTLYLTDVSVSNGHATTSVGGVGGKGGGIYNTGSLFIGQSTISGNIASSNFTPVSGEGGGIYSTGTISITNSTLSGNSADDLGGGLFSSGPASMLLNDTFAVNTAADGGSLNAGGSLSLKNTILAGGGGGNCSTGTLFTSLGHNMSDDTSCTSLTAGGDLNSAPANLGALANNGGQTKTHLPQPGSSAIDNGDDTGCPPQDQRHFARPQGVHCDIGSVEVAYPATISSLAPNSRAAGTAGFSLQVHGSNFVPGASVLWNGSARSTVLNDSTLVTAFIPASDLNSVNTATVTVQNPGTTPSNGLGFSVFDAGDIVSDCSEYGLDGALFNGGNITFICGPATITISAQKVIGSNTTMDGGNKVSISGGGTTGIFNVTAGTHLGLANLTLSNGNVSGCGVGGAIQNAGTLGVTNVSFTSNLSTCYGGAIDNHGTATVTNSSFMSNTADGNGGAINNSTSMTVTNSQFTGNFTNGAGGGLNNDGTLVVIGSTFTGNSAGLFGGGVNNEANATIDNSTIISNSAGSLGGGIHNLRGAGTLIVSASRILSNTAQRGGGLDNYGALTVTASVMAGNIAGQAGGGIYNVHTLLVIGSTFTGNSTLGLGGGVDNESNATIDNSMFIANSATSLGGGIHNGGPGGTMIVSASRLISNTAPGGGGLSNDGFQIVSTSFFTGNMASTGGGIYNRLGTLSISASTLVANFGSAAGGGIANQHALTITGSTLSANVADSGAGIINTGTLGVNASTFNLNSANSNGGGIENAGTLGVTNSTFSANSAGNYGGGIDSSNYLTLTTGILNSTFVSNTAALAGGSLYRNGGPILLKNTIVAYSTLQNCAANAGNFSSLGHNLDTGTSCNFTAVSDLSNTDPKLGPLQNNGGPTLTHALLRGSLAIDAGDNAGCPGTDQRGVARPLDGNGDGVAVCDIGAYEANQLLRLFLPLIRR